MFDRIEKFLFEISLWFTVISRKECEQIFEHTTRSSRCRNKLHDLMIIFQVTFPQIEIILRLLFVKR